MTVAGAKLFSNRDVYEITYDKGDGEGAPEVPEPPDGWPEHPIAGPPASPAHPIVLPDEPHPEPH